MFSATLGGNTLEAYGETAVNYNRDVEVFPVLNACLLYTSSGVVLLFSQ